MAVGLLAAPQARLLIGFTCLARVCAPPPQDMSNFYEQYQSIQPWLQRKSDKPNASVEHLQSREDRKKLDGMYEVGGLRTCSARAASRTSAAVA